MNIHGNTIRILLAVYLAFGLPLCCCHISAAAACCAPANSSEAAVFLAVANHDHDADHHDHDHGHAQSNHVHVSPDQQAPGADPPLDSSVPCENDGSCDCGSEGKTSRLLEKSITIDLPVLTLATVYWASPVVIVNQPNIRPPAQLSSGPPTSLVHMHCALII